MGNKYTFVYCECCAGCNGYKPVLPIKVYKVGGISYTTTPREVTCSGCDDIYYGNITSEYDTVTVWCSGGDDYSSVEAAAYDACGRLVYYGNAISSSMTVSYYDCYVGADGSAGPAWCGA